MRALALLLLLAAPAPVAPTSVKPATSATVTLSFLEPAGRIKIGEQKLELPLDGKAKETALTLGGSVEGFRVRTVSRDVKVNGEIDGLWVELTILAKDGSEAGYLAVTFPDAPGASAATKFKGARGAPIAAVLTR